MRLLGHEVSVEHGTGLYCKRCPVLRALRKHVAHANYACRMTERGSKPIGHVPVLIREVAEVLDPRPGETVVDCTAGLGGHAEMLARAVGTAGAVVLFDLDPGNLASARSRLEGIAGGPKVIAVHASFNEAPRRLPDMGLRADVVLADLGFSSNQIDSAQRGFAFSKDGPLDMRLDPTSPLTAAELVNTLSTRELARILKEFGEEARSRTIAEKIGRERVAQPITTTGRLAEIVRSAVPHDYRTKSSIHPATKTFQALRIAVNDEIGRLGSLLDAVYTAAKKMNTSRRDAHPTREVWLKEGSRVGIIAFHSLEDRPVKKMFGRLGDEGLATVLTKKPAEAADDEVRDNPRSRSAKFRACRIGT